MCGISWQRAGHVLTQKAILCPIVSDCLDAVIKHVCANHHNFPKKIQDLLSDQISQFHLQPNVLILSVSAYGQNFILKTSGKALMFLSF